MKFAKVSILFWALSAPALMLAGQARSSSSNDTTPSNAVLTSSIVQPSLDVLKQAMAAMSIDKWKASNAIKSEADSNLHSVQKDIQSTLPPMLSAADAAPDSVAKTLPVFRNIDALYDVMLRLDAAGRLAAPKDQISALDQALAGLSDARRSLGDQVQASAGAQDALVGRLQAAVKAIPPPTPAPEPIACAPAPTKKKKATPPKAAAKPTSTLPATSLH